MTKMQKQAHLLGSIEDLLKQAAVEDEKTAEANTEPGSQGGSTTHPVKDVDDGTETAQEGARSSENESDVKEDQGPAGVDNTAEGPGAGQDSVQMDVGITTKATGEDSATENDFKPGKDDPGSSHPARTDNDSLDGLKYSADFSAVQDLCKQAEAAGVAYISSVTWDSQDQAKRAAAVTGNEAAPVVESKEASEEAAQAGYDLANVFANIDLPVEDKQAADQMVVDTLSNVVGLASNRAEKTAAFLQSHFDNLQKQSEGEGEESPPFLEGEGGEEGPPPPQEEGGDPSMMMPEEGGEAGGSEEEQLLQLLAGGNEMGGDEALGSMVGEEMGGELPEGGGDPMAGGGGEESLAALLGGAGGGEMGGPEMGGPEMGGGMGGPEMGGGMGGPEMGGPEMGGEGGGQEGELEMLQQILAENGLSLEDLEGGMMQPKVGALRKKIAKASRNYKTAKDAYPTKYAAMESVVLEICRRGRK
jgi:hypothetical protein